MRIFVDMDGVVVDFDRYMREHGLTGDEVKRRSGAYLVMQPIDGAIAAVRSMIGMGHEVWLATKPPTGLPFAYADKVGWVLMHLPELKRNVILTHNKGLLRGDLLIDDRPHKASCADFEGFVWKFVAGDWPRILADLRVQAQREGRFTRSEQCA